MHLLPFARTSKSRGSRLTLCMVTINLTDGVLGRIARTSHRQSRTCPFHETGRELIVHFRNSDKRILGSDKNSCRTTSTFASGTWIVRTVAHGIVLSRRTPLTIELGRREILLQCKLRNNRDIGRKSRG
jgi:hypothetical protein